MTEGTYCRGERGQDGGGGLRGVNCLPNTRTLSSPTEQIVCVSWLVGPQTFHHSTTDLEVRSKSGHPADGCWLTEAGGADKT